MPEFLTRKPLFTNRTGRLLLSWDSAPECVIRIVLCTTIQRGAHHLLKQCSQIGCKPCCSQICRAFCYLVKAASMNVWFKPRCSQIRKVFHSLVNALYLKFYVELLLHNSYGCTRSDEFYSQIGVNYFRLAVHKLYSVRIFPKANAQWEWLWICLKIRTASCSHRW